jgi:hypothetical protein
MIGTRLERFAGTVALALVCGCNDPVVIDEPTHEGGLAVRDAAWGPDSPAPDGGAPEVAADAASDGAPDVATDVVTDDDGA